MTALLQACYRGNVEIAQILVDSGANVNWSKHKQGYTALMFAALSGKLEIVEFLLSCGAKTEVTNCLKRTAAEMASFVGNHFATALINTFIEKEELFQYTRKKASTNLYLSNDLIEPLHKLVTRLNFSPVKTFMYLSCTSGKPLLDKWKNVSSVLEDLAGQYFTPHRTHEPIAIKLHLIGASVKRAGEFVEKEINDEDKKANNVIVLEPLIKHFLRGTDPHGLPKGKFQLFNLLLVVFAPEVFLRKSLVSFGHTESTLWRQTVTQVGSVEPGEAPTALSILENCINGLSPFSRSCPREGVISEPCATCSDMAGYSAAVSVKWCSRCHEVAYCSVACQKMHWFTHKKYCPILQEHHKSVSESGAKKDKPSSEEISKIQEEVTEFLQQQKLHGV
ncbi:unnamed protein product [Mesocestoides corti]|uniref:MYND-type domain-containing protein n=1 Tax=Mesocestoides corti TaxID=53468 RepID=A0A0R3U1S5_MESCO|nr:unnamed protein product [Mesocestoides corti]